MNRAEKIEIFERLQRILIRCCFRYYIDDNPILSDGEYDGLERDSFRIAKDLGFRADRNKGAMENEKHHAHWRTPCYDPDNQYWRK